MSLHIAACYFSIYVHVLWSVTRIRIFIYLPKIRYNRTPHLQFKARVSTGSKFTHRTGKAEIIGMVDLNDENVQMVAKVVGGTLVATVTAYVIWKRFRKPTR